MLEDDPPARTSQLASLFEVLLCTAGSVIAGIGAFICVGCGWLFGFRIGAAATSVAILAFAWRFGTRQAGNYKLARQTAAAALSIGAITGAILFVAILPESWG